MLETNDDIEEQGKLLAKPVIGMQLIVHFIISTKRIPLKCKSVLTKNNIYITLFISQIIKKIRFLHYSNYNKKEEL